MHIGGLARCVGVVLALAGAAMAAGSELEAARKLYNRTDFEQSLGILQAIPNKNAAVYELIGRDYYMLSEYKKATEVLEKAVAAEPGNAGYSLWLGRAYGRRAETSSLFTAPGFATKARQYFEKAVQLDPTFMDAQSDVFEYYLEAPGFLGGGMDKAAATAKQIAAINPAEGYWAQAKLDEKRKEYTSAEAHLRRAIELAPQHVGRILDLARLLAGQGRYRESDQSFERAEKLAPGSPRVMYAKADSYIKAHRNLDDARNLLKRYLNSSLTPDDPPRSEAAKLLQKVRGS